jgi:class 3 adenylate cyclase
LIAQRASNNLGRFLSGRNPSLAKNGYNHRMAREYYFDWHVDLKSSPEALWPFAADTNRFNHDTGLPAIEFINDATDVRPGARRLAFNLLGQRVEWDEEPFDWIFPHHFGVIRHYKKGPLAEMRVECDLTAVPEGTHLRYQVWAKAGNPLGQLAIGVQIGILSARRFIETFQGYDAIAQKSGSHYDIAGNPRFAPGGRERLRAAQQSLAGNQVQGAVLDHLTHLLEHADDLALQRIRPYQLAGYWNLPRRAVLETFLRATQAGLLDMRWELLCPMCRGAQESHTSLHEVHSNTRCNYCNIDFSVNFDRQVEVVFRPNPSVRIIPEQLMYCLAGPQAEPHLVLKQTLQPGEQTRMSVTLSVGQYAISASNLPGEISLSVEEKGPREIDLAPGEDGWPETQIQAAPRPVFRFTNRTSTPQTIYVERTAWRDDAATAADVTSLQVFRDLFSREALRAGEEISIGSVTLMFTDLRDSTRLYRQIGDAPAFGRVRQHFELLEQAIAAEGGAVVKTMGDAVMAVFREPAAALRAARSAHAEITRAEGTPPLYLKAGIHSGPCIAVTLNERLDYFGSTVNIAARLPDLANGGEVVFTHEIASDAEADAWCRANQLPISQFEAALKGFDTPFALRKLGLVRAENS